MNTPKTFKFSFLDIFKISHMEYKASSTPSYFETTVTRYIPHKKSTAVLVKLLEKKFCPLPRFRMYKLFKLIQFLDFSFENRARSSFSILIGIIFLFKLFVWYISVYMQKNEEILLLWLRINLNLCVSNRCFCLSMSL